MTDSPKMNATCSQYQRKLTLNLVLPFLRPLLRGSDYWVGLENSTVSEAIVSTLIHKWLVYETRWDASVGYFNQLGLLTGPRYYYCTYIERLSIAMLIT